MNFWTPYPPLLIWSSSDQDRNALPLVIEWQDHHKVKRERGKPREYNCIDWSIDKYCSDTSQEKGYSASLSSHAQPNTHRFIIIFDSKIEMIVLSTCLNIIEQRHEISNNVAFWHK